MLPYRRLEHVVRGFSNHRRIEILALLSQGGSLSVLDVAYRLKINFRTASEHLRRLYAAGMVTKHNQGAAVLHKITNVGIIVLKFLRTLE